MHKTSFEYKLTLTVILATAILFVTIAVLLSSISDYPEKTISPVVENYPRSVVVTPSAWPTIGVDRLIDLFSNHSSTHPKDTVSLVITGDVIPARSVNRIMRQADDFTFPFSDVAHVLKAADISIINLEAPLIHNCPTTDTGMTFCGNPRFVEGLLSAGVDLANLANNHSSNYGKTGIDETIDHLTSSEIAVVGIGPAVHITRKGNTFAFLGFNGVSPLHSDLAVINLLAIAEAIRLARPTADVIVVAFHWGKEYVRFPQADKGIAPHDPVDIAHFTIDAGADVVVGNHPHWYQGIEIYQGKPIFYALGNLIFDQFWSEETKKGFLATLYFQRSTLIDLQIQPVYIEGIRPVIAKDPIRSEILSVIKTSSQELNK